MARKSGKNRSELIKFVTSYCLHDSTFATLLTRSSDLVILMTVPSGSTEEVPSSMGLYLSIYVLAPIPSGVNC